MIPYSKYFRNVILPELKKRLIVKYWPGLYSCAIESKYTADLPIMYSNNIKDKSFCYSVYMTFQQIYLAMYIFTKGRVLVRPHKGQNVSLFIEERLFSHPTTDTIIHYIDSV